MQSLFDGLVRISPARIMVAEFALWLTGLLLIAFLPNVEARGALEDDSDLLAISFEGGDGLGRSGKRKAEVAID